MIHIVPHISRIPVDNKTRNEILDTLDFVFGKLNKEEARIFLFSLLSPTEKLMLAKRLAVIILLNQGTSESEISSALNVTRVTVSRMQLLLLTKKEGFDLALKKLGNIKRMEEFKKMLMALARYSARAAGGRVKPEIF